MIIQIRGTSGSGKSTLVRKIIDLFGDNYDPIHVQGRKQPLLMLLRTQSPELADIAVLGHYNTPCGGCDTISKNMRDYVYELIREYHGKGHHVLYEGLLLTEEVNRAIKLHEDGLPFRVLHIDIPSDECVASVNERRRAKKPDAEDVNPKNTLIKHHGTINAMQKLRKAGVPCFAGSREACYVEVLELLGLDQEFGVG